MKPCQKEEELTSSNCDLRVQRYLEPIYYHGVYVLLNFKKEYGVDINEYQKEMEEYID